MHAINIAKEFFKNKKKSSWEIQKLTYYAQMLSLYLYNEPLFDDDIVVLKDGPAIINVQEKFKEDKKLKMVEGVKESDSKAKLIIDYTLKFFGGYKGRALRDMTHKKGGAWDRVVKEKHITDFSKSKNIKIENSYIKNEINLYEDIIKELNKAAEIDKYYLYNDIDNILKEFE